MNTRKLIKEEISDFISDELIDNIKEKLVGKKIKHFKHGEGTIKNVDLDFDSGLDFDDLKLGILYVDFPERGLTGIVFTPENNRFYEYLIDEEEIKNIKDELISSIKQADSSDKEAEKKKIIDKTIRLAMQHFPDSYDAWYKYLTGRIKTKPIDFDYNIDTQVYIDTWESLKQKRKAASGFERRLWNAYGTIEDTYEGDVPQLFNWLAKNITRITFAPSRDADSIEAKEELKKFLDYLRDVKGGNIDNVHVGNARGDLNSYTMYLKNDALDTCPDVKAFLAWKAPKLDLKSGEEVIKDVYDTTSNNISSRRVVLDYILSKDDYVKNIKPTEITEDKPAEETFEEDEYILNFKPFEEALTEELSDYDSLNIEVDSVDKVGDTTWKASVLICNEIKDECLEADIIFNVDEDLLEFDWEEDNRPTYVPYGEGSVLLDSGKGEVEDVYVEDALSIDNSDFDFRYTENGKEDILTDIDFLCEVIDIDKKDYKALRDHILDLAFEKVEKEIKEYYKENPVNY